MKAEKYFREMYADIWQSRHLDKFDNYYAKNFEEIISTCDENKNPVEIKMKYDDLLKQAIWQKENYKNTTLDVRKIAGDTDNHISVYFYSSSVEKKTNTIRHRLVCGIWRLDHEMKIDRVWAVVTPCYPV